MRQRNQPRSKLMPHPSHNSDSLFDTMYEVVEDESLVENKTQPPKVKPRYGVQAKEVFGEVKAGTPSDGEEITRGSGSALDDLEIDKDEVIASLMEEVAEAILKTANIPYVIEEKKSNADLIKPLETKIAQQTTLINILEASLENLHDILEDSESLLEEETIDDIFSIGATKDQVGELIKQVHTWRQTQS